MTSQEKAQIEVNSHHVMHVALFLLRRIVDLHVTEAIPGANIVPWESVEPRAWEIDSYLRVGAVHLISSASSTLQSLVQLLGECSMPGPIQLWYSLDKQFFFYFPSQTE